MEHYTRFLDRFKWWIVILIPLLVLAMSLSLKNIAYEGGYRIWFDEDSQTLREYDYFKKVFGSDDFMIISFKDEKGILNPKALGSVERITDTLWRTPHIERVLSLTNVPYIHTQNDDVSVDPFIENPEVQDSGYFAHKEKAALSDPMIHPLLISNDGKTTLIMTKVVADARDGEKDLSFEIRDSVQKILDAETARTGYTYHLGGAIPIQTSMVEVMLRELMIFIPLITLCVIAMLLLIYRRLSAPLIQMSIVGLVILIIVSSGILAGYKFNNFTADIPVFILAIGIGTTVHIFTTWHEQINRGTAPFDAVRIALDKNILAVFLTSLTTAVGFASLAVSPIIPIYTLGLMTAAAVILVFILSIVLMPAMLLLIPRPKQLSDHKRVLSFHHYGRFILRYNRHIVWAAIGIFIVLGYGLSKVNVDSNLIKFLDEKVPVRESTDFVMENITGPMSYEIVVDSRDKEGIKDPAFMRAVEAFSNDFQKEFPQVRNVSSLLLVVKQFNRLMHRNDPAYYQVPSSAEAIAQYILFYSLSLPQGLEISDSIDVNERYLRITANTDITSSKNDLKMIAWAEQWWKEHTPYSAKVYGQTAMFAKMQSDITQTLLYSIASSILLVSLVMLIVFRNIRLLYIYILPNLLPFLLVLGVMGWLGIDVDLGIAISGAVILGIAVDDTLHFLTKYFSARKQGLTIEASLDYVAEHAGVAMILSTLILSLAFATLIASLFIPNAHFGTVTAIALIIALVLDLLFVPALLSLADREK